MIDTVNSAAEPPPPWYRQFWPWLLISIPLATVVAGVATIWVASREPVALVHDDYYKEGLAVNQNLARDQQAADLHLRATLRVDTAAGVIDGLLVGDNAISGIVAVLIHPVASRYDQTLQIQVSEDGKFTLPLPEHGKRWYVELRGEDKPGWRLQGAMPTEQNATVILASQNIRHAERLQHSVPTPQD